MSEEGVTHNVRVGENFILPIVLIPGEDGYLVAMCPILPGCISQGATREEALRNVAEAARVTLSRRDDEGWEIPSEYLVEILEVPV